MAPAQKIKGRSNGRGCDISDKETKQTGEIRVELTSRELEIIRLEYNKALDSDIVFTYICDRPRGAQRQRVKGERYPITASGLRRVVKNTLIKVGIANFHIHYFRHTFASRAMEAEGDLHALMLAMDHQDITSTMRYLNSGKKRAQDVRESVQLNRELDSGIPNMSRSDTKKPNRRATVH